MSTLALVLETTEKKGTAKTPAGDVGAHNERVRAGQAKDNSVVL